MRQQQPSQPVLVRSRLALALAGTLLLIAGALSIAPASASAATTYPTYSYLAGHRSGSAIYLNALIKQGSAAGVVRSSHRTVYVQRVINGSWQNMLSRVTSSTGQFAVGFISVPNYSYRLVVPATGSAAPGHSATLRTTTPPPPVQPTCGAPANPYGYNFCGRGSLIYSPAAGICGYFACIGNFYNGVGYLEQCQDGMFSMSGGRRGACSYHGGELRPVYG